MGSVSCERVPERGRGKALRLRAWSWTREQVGDTWRGRELYDCEALCVIEGEPFRPGQARLRCALPGFPERHWEPSPKGGPYMGRLPIMSGPDANAEPPETHDEGCPGAWYRCGFVASLAKYERHCSDGVYSPNVLLDRCDDPLVIEAIQVLEQERARAREHMLGKMR